MRTENLKEDREDKREDVLNRKILIKKAWQDDWEDEKVGEQSKGRGDLKKEEVKKKRHRKRGNIQKQERIKVMVREGGWEEEREREREVIKAKIECWK